MRSNPCFSRLKFSAKNSLGFFVVLSFIFIEATSNERLANPNGMGSSRYGTREQLYSMASRFTFEFFLSNPGLKRHCHLTRIGRCRGGFQMDTATIHFGTNEDSPAIFHPLGFHMIRYSMHSLVGFNKLLGHLEGIPV